MSTWTESQKKKIKQKVKMFELRDNGQSGDWPNGIVLMIKIFPRNSKYHQEQSYLFLNGIKRKC